MYQCAKRNHLPFPVAASNASLLFCPSAPLRSLICTNHVPDTHSAVEILFSKSAYARFSNEFASGRTHLSGHLSNSTVSGVRKDQDRCLVNVVRVAEIVSSRVQQQCTISSSPKEAVHEARHSLTSAGIFENLPACSCMRPARDGHLGRHKFARLETRHSTSCIASPPSTEDTFSSGFRSFFFSDCFSVI